MQLCVSVYEVTLHVPPAHIGLVHWRVRVPVSSHEFAYPPQSLQALHVTVPQEAPSVSRSHASVSVPIVLSQLPSAHACVVTILVLVPVSSHVPE